MSGAAAPGAPRTALTNRLAPPILGVLGAALVLLRQADYGVGLTWDSASYLSAARSLVAGDGLVIWNGSRYAAVPLFPYLLAAAELFGIDAAAAARYLNAAAFGLTVFTVAVWLQRHVSVLLAVWAGCACALLPALVSAAAYAWTDTVFVLCAVVSLALLDRFLGRPATTTLLLAAAAAAAACLTRYVGATLLGAGALMLLLRPGAGLRTRIRDAALWSAVSLAPVGVWAARNLLVMGSPFGIFFANGFSGLISLHRATGEFARWLFGSMGFEALSGALVIVTGIDLAGSATAAAVAVKAALLAAPALGAGYALARRRPGFLRRRRAVLTVPLVFAAAYALYMAVFLPLADGVLRVRYLLPLFPPLLVAATVVLDELAASKKTGAAVPVVLAIVISVWLAQQAGAVYRDTRAWLNYGAGYTSRGWIESDVLRYLRANRLDGPVWTSEPPLLYFFTELRRVWTISGSLAGLTESLANRDPAEAVYLVLLERSFRIRGYDYEVDDVAALPGVELVAALDDGAIFRSGAAAEDRVVRAHFDIYRYGDALAYFKQPCTADDVMPRFFLRVTPVEHAAFARDFSFAEHGYLLDGRCLAVVALPDYEIARLSTGQYVPGTGNLWEAAFAP